MNAVVLMNPDQGGSKWISASTRGSCSHHGFRGEGALHDPHVLRVACVPSSPQISYLITITRIHSRTKTHTKNPLSVPQISWADACGWCDTATEAQTSYSQTLSTSVPSYRRHFTPSKPSCLGICFVGVELVLSRLFYVNRGLTNIFEKIQCFCVWAWDRTCLVMPWIWLFAPQISLCCFS